VVPKSPIAKAFNYAVNHRVPLTRFLEDGHLRLDNNISELQLRREVVGRRNWIFCGSAEGARWNTIATSLIASCQLHDLNPFEYLRDVLTLIQSWPAQGARELSPKYWAETRQRSDTVETLNGSVLWQAATRPTPVEPRSFSLAA
jgi:transposase